nr:calcium and integrin-binding protein 1-like [Cherax quadricarinatus]
MGQGNSQFTEAELEEYQELTYFTKKEILYAHKRFKNLALEKVGHNRNAKLPMDKLLTLPELRANPFGERMCFIFSSTKLMVILSRRRDLEETITKLVSPQRFSPGDMEALVSRVLEEADLDDDGMLAFAEFEHVISKSPDFADSFRIRL